MKPPFYATAGECPNKADHTPCPSGYLEWHTWAAAMNQSHRQVRCKTCHLYAIWVQRGTNVRVTAPLAFPGPTCLVVLASPVVSA